MAFATMDEGAAVLPARVRMLCVGRSHIRVLCDVQPWRPRQNRRPRATSAFSGRTSSPEAELMALQDSNLLRVDGHAIAALQAQK